MVRPVKWYFRTASPVSPVLQRPKDKGRWFLVAVLFVVGLGIVMLPPVDAGCRPLVRKECEKICQSNGVCELRIVVIMPANTSVEASLPRVQPVLEKAEEDIRRRGIIPAKVNISWISYDDRCEQARATVMAMDGTGSETCGHVILGPTCDFALGKLGAQLILLP